MTKLTPKNIVVLLSGGLDSSVVSYLACKESKSNIKNRVYLLTFDYGQRHRRELASAIKIGKKIKAKEHKIVKLDLTLWGGSALTDSKIKVPKNRKIFNSKFLTFKSTPLTYVPCRNTIFLSFALAFAEAVKAREIYIGVNSIDYSGYVDCRVAFIKKFQELANLAIASSVDGKTVKIKTPLIKKSKTEIVKLGQKLKVDFKNTWSCYEGNKLACGLCDSCQLRLKGFMLAGIRDLLHYKQYPRFYKKWLHVIASKAKQSRSIVK